MTLKEDIIQAFNSLYKAINKSKEKLSKKSNHNLLHKQEPIKQKSNFEVENWFFDDDFIKGLAIGIDKGDIKPKEGTVSDLIKIDEGDIVIFYHGTSSGISVSVADIYERLSMQDQRHLIKVLDSKNLITSLRKDREAQEKRDKIISKYTIK